MNRNCESSTHKLKAELHNPGGTDCGLATWEEVESKIRRHKRCSDNKSYVVTERRFTDQSEIGIASGIKTPCTPGRIEREECFLP